jgi:hypothetical protein
MKKLDEVQKVQVISKEEQRKIVGGVSPTLPPEENELGPIQGTLIREWIIED